MTRSIPAVVALLLAIATAGSAECGERLDLGRGVRKAGDPLVEAMDAAAAKAGMDGMILVEIASIVEDAQRMRLSQTLKVQTAAAGARSVAEEAERGGLYGFDEKAWLKAASPLVAVARSDEKVAAGRPRREGKTVGATRQILEMRRDPVFATEVAASALKAGMPAFREAFGRDPSPGEMLVMHLFGADAAVRVTKAALRDATTPCTQPLGAAAGRPSVRPFVTTTSGATLSARALAVTAEVAMAIKAKFAHRLLDRLRA